MAYVRKKKTKGGEYYQLVEGRRENGKVKQRVLAHLGKCKTVERALWWWPGRILRMRHVTRDLRKSHEVTWLPESLRKDLRGVDSWGRPYSNPEEAKHYRDLALRFMDDDGNMRRLKLAPHQLKEAIYNYNTDNYSWFERLLIKQAEYWRWVDYAEKLEREADELEERYVKLYAINGGAPEEARGLLRDRFQRLLDAHERRGQRRRALQEEKRAHWAKSKGLEDADPIRQLGYALNGSQMAVEEAWANKEK